MALRLPSLASPKSFVPTPTTAPPQSYSTCGRQRRQQRGRVGRRRAAPRGRPRPHQRRRSPAPHMCQRLMRAALRASRGGRLGAHLPARKAGEHVHAQLLGLGGQPAHQLAAGQGSAGAAGCKIRGREGAAGRMRDHAPACSAWRWACDRGSCAATAAAGASAAHHAAGPAHLRLTM